MYCRCYFLLDMSFIFSTFASNFITNYRSVKSERIYNHHLRQLHFIEEVNKLWKKSSSKHPNFKKLCAVASSSTAPRFYITPRQALEKYAQYQRTGSIDVSSTLTEQMYLCIFERYEAALAARNGSDFKYSIMQDVLDEPAPSFYISPTAAVVFYYRAMAYKRSLARK